MLPVSQKVYQLFLSELERQLGQAHAALIDEHELPSPEEAKALGALFHTIRGGAGFLGIPDMASKAAELDLLLRKANVSLQENIGTVRSLLTELEDLAHNLPPLADDKKKNA